MTPLSDQIHSAHDSLSKQGPRLLRVELCFLCLQSGASRYYTTASASPATTNIPTTTAVSTTVKSSVLVGNKQS